VSAPDSNGAFAVEVSEGKIDSILAELNQSHLPGGALGIAIDAKPVYRKGFGLANMELPLALSPTTKQRIGSTTKHFACLAYMLLCEEGKAGVDDPIGRHLPELHPVTHKVTLRQLMGNVGGLRDVFDIAWVFSGIGRPVSSCDMLALYREIDDANAAPGTAWIYNNGGFLILSAVIERVAQRSLEDVLSERIFTPLGMHDTLLRRFDTDFVPNSATLHSGTPTDGFNRSYLGTEHVGEGGIVSTVDDMLRWLAHMDEPVVGTPATWELMKAPQLLANGTSTGYGLGLVTELYRGIETLSHSGAVMGGNSQMLKVPCVGLDVAIMLNRDDVSGVQLTNRILDACVTGLKPDIDPPTGLFSTGSYCSPRTGRVVQLFAKDRQQIASIDGFDLPFTSGDSDVLSPMPPFESLKQSVTLIGDRRQPRSIQFRDFGNVDELIPVRVMDKPDARAIIGRYRSDTTGTEATIRATRDGLHLGTAGRFGSAAYPLEFLADGIWRAKPLSKWPWGGIVSFDADRKTFRYSTPRTWALTFRREG
jgi:CubicO group peptidase (beta-lactamase class C family)